MWNFYSPEGNWIVIEETGNILVILTGPILQQSMYRTKSKGVRPLIALDSKDQKMCCNFFFMI